MSNSSQKQAHLKSGIQIFKNSLYLRQESIEIYPNINQEQQRAIYIKDHLIEDQERRNLQKRNMSLHVGSRWYRAPEISLIEKQYDFATDMWSFGCIIHELIQYFIALNFTHKESFKKDFQKLRYIYQSNSCFPLSPYEENKKDKQ